MRSSVLLHTSVTAACAAFEACPCGWQRLQAGPAAAAHSLAAGLHPTHPPNSSAFQSQTLYALPTRVIPHTCVFPMRTCVHLPFVCRLLGAVCRRAPHFICLQGTYSELEAPLLFDTALVSFNYYQLTTLSNTCGSRGGMLSCSAPATERR